MSRPNIILTGFMGSGKTTVGKLLARELNYAFVDTDHLIADRCGMSVQEIFKTDGEEAFRTMEADVARELGTRQGMVIATGGRLMLDLGNAEALEAQGRVFCLAAQPEDILQRVSMSTQGQRPLLDTPNPMESIIKLIREREASYARFTRINTSGKSPWEVTQDILVQFKETGYSSTVD